MSPEIVNGIFALGGAVVGALIAGGFALYISRSSKEKREIVVSTSNPSKLLVVRDIVRHIEILVSGRRVENVILSEIFFSNTGNKAVENLRFPVSCQEQCEIISISVLDQATDMPRTGADAKQLGNNKISVDIDYLNPGEELSLRCIVSGENPYWTVELRQPELIVIRREGHVSSHSDVVSEVLFATIASFPLMSVYFKIASPVFKKYLEKKKVE